LKYQVNGEYFLRELQRSDDIGLDGFILIEAVCIIESTTSSSSSGKGDDDAIMVDKKADWRCTILLLQSAAITI
jgi:hypothetical protein